MRAGARRGIGSDPPGVTSSPGRVAAWRPVATTAWRLLTSAEGATLRERRWLVFGSLMYPALALPSSAIALAVEAGPAASEQRLLVAAVVTAATAAVLPRFSPWRSDADGYPRWQLAAGYSALAVVLNVWASRQVGPSDTETSLGVYWPLMQGAVPLWLALSGPPAAILAIVAGGVVSLVMIETSAASDVIGTWTVAPFVGWLGLALAVALGIRAVVRARALDALARGLETGERAERSRNQRRMHDTALQALESISLLTSASELPAAERIDAISEIARTEAHRMRQDLARSRPPDLDEALAELVSSSRAAGLPVRLERHGGSLAGVPAAVREACMGAVSEALTNVRRHAAASAVTLRVSASVDSLGVTVVDDGVGFAAHLARSGYGLRESIVARVTETGGEVAVWSRPGEGTSISLHFHWDESAPARSRPRARRKSADPATKSQTSASEGAPPAVVTRSDEVGRRVG